MSRRRKNNKFKKKTKHTINNQIKYKIDGDDVKLVSNSGEPEIMELTEALNLADDYELDLMLVGPKGEPPVVKMIDYSKYLYEQKKKKPKTKPKPMKEVRFGPNTDTNDLEFKTNHIIKFLKKGHKVKALVFFKGREMVFKDKGEKLLLELAVTLKEYGSADNMPKLEGRKMNIIFNPETK